MMLIWNMEEFMKNRKALVRKTLASDSSELSGVVELD